MFKLSRDKYIAALESAEELEKTLKEENENLRKSSKNLTANWHGAQAERSLGAINESLETGNHAKALAYTHGMTSIMGEYLPEIEKLMAKREQIGQQLKQDEYVAPDLTSFSEKELIVDYDKIDDIKADVEGALHYGDRAIEILEGMMDDAEECAGEYLDFTQLREELEKGKKKLHRLENYRDEFVDYARKMSDLEYNMSMDLSNVMREQGDEAYLTDPMNMPQVAMNIRTEQMEREDNLAEMLKERGLTEEQYNAALLDVFMYLDFFNDDKDNSYYYEEIEKKLYDGMTINEILEILGEYELYTDEPTEGGSTRHIYYQILQDAVKQNPQLGDFQLSHMSRRLTMKDTGMEYNEGTNGIVFTDPFTNNIYVAYRGTSMGEWIEDGNRFNCKDREDLTPQMEQTIHYFDYVAESMGWTEKSNIYVTGHSQGGNDAQISILLSDYGHLVDQCYSFDGKGHSPEQLRSIEEYLGTEEYEERRSRMYSICGEYDFVNRLGEKVIPEENTIYIKCNFELTDVARCHDIVSMFCDENMNYNGMMNTGIGTAPSWVTEYTATLWEELYEMPPELRESCQTALLGVAEKMLSGGECKEGLNGEKASGIDNILMLTYGVDAIVKSGSIQINEFENEVESKIALKCAEYMLNTAITKKILTEEEIQEIYNDVQEEYDQKMEEYKSDIDDEQMEYYELYEVGESCVDYIIEKSEEVKDAVEKFVDGLKETGINIIVKTAPYMGRLIQQQIENTQPIGIYPIAGRWEADS